MRLLSLPLPMLMLSAALCIAPAFGGGRAHAGGYGAFDWGESVKSIGKKLGKQKLSPHTALEAAALEARVLRAERDEKVRLARLKKRPAADIRRLQKAKPGKPRLSAGYYWVALGPLDAKVVLQFLDERLTGTEVQVLFEAPQRAAAAELLDLMQAKYGAPKEHRGAEAPTAPALDVFDGGDTEIEAYQQPAVNGRSGFLRLVYRSKDRHESVVKHLESLEARWQAISQARNPPGPTPEERDAQRKALLMQHL